MFFLSLPGLRQLSRYVPADAGFLSDNGVLLVSTIGNILSNLKFFHLSYFANTIMTTSTKPFQNFRTLLISARSSRLPYFSRRDLPQYAKTKCRMRNSKSMRTWLKKTAAFRKVTTCMFIEFIDILPKSQLIFFYQNARRPVALYSNFSVLPGFW